MTKVCKVLIIEDDGDVRAVFGRILKHEGYRFTLVGSVAAARRALQSESDIDVVIIDVVLPGGGDGLSLATEIASQGYGVILVTGHHDHYERVEKSGHGYIFKPFRLPSLLALIEKTLQDSRRHCERRAGEREADVA
jgi:two-component system phosphate regulon response regulator OmpR